MVDFYKELFDNNSLPFYKLLEIKQRNFTMEVKKIPVSKISGYLSNFKVFIIFLSIHVRKIHTLIQFFREDIDKSIYDNFLIQVKAYIQKIPRIDFPSCEQTRSVITILYLLSEEAIFQNNILLLEVVAKVYSFEHIHLRLSRACERDEMLPILIKNYDYGYDIPEFNLLSRYKQNFV